jgi:hypothetical protein
MHRKRRAIHTATQAADTSKLAALLVLLVSPELWLKCTDYHVNGVWWLPARTLHMKFS